MPNAIAYNRRLTNEELVTVTSWPRLTERTPVAGQLCRVVVIHPDFSSEIEEGVWCPAGVYDASQLGIIVTDGATTEQVKMPATTDGSFRTERGALISDPKFTYWRAK